MQIIPLSNSFVADVADVDVGAVDDVAFGTIYAAWLRCPILRIRGQTLHDDALKDFSRRFGPLEYAPMGRISDEELAKLPNPYVTTISNIVVNGRPIGGLGAAEAAWHTDMSYIEHPPTASLLYAVETPASGGDTHFLQHDRRLRSVAGSNRRTCPQGRSEARCSPRQHWQAASRTPACRRSSRCARGRPSHGSATP